MNSQPDLLSLRSNFRPLRLFLGQRCQVRQLDETRACPGLSSTHPRTRTENVGIMPYVGTGVSRAAGGAAYGGVVSQARDRDLLKRERARMGTGGARGS